MKLSRGFSLVEVLIVIGIMALITSVMMFSGTAFRQSQALHEATQVVLSVINQARAHTLSSIGYSQYGVRLESDRIIMFKGSSWPGTDHVTTALPAGVSLSSVLAAGATEVVFRRVTGTTSQTGTITLTGSGGATRRVVIEPTGLAREG